jgi:MipA family protein
MDMLQRTFTNSHVSASNGNVQSTDRLGLFSREGNFENFTSRGARWQMFLATAVVALVALPLSMRAALAEDVSQNNGPSYTIGVGLVSEPTYEGAKATDVSAIPFVEITGLFGGRVFVSGRDGIGVNLLDRGPWQAGVALSYNGDRKSSDDPRLLGLPDVKGGGVAEAFVSYEMDPLSFNLKVQSNLGSTSGTEMTLGATYSAEPTSRLHVSIGPSITWADRKYLQNNFGITQTAADNATSLGNPLSAYSPGAGIKNVELNLDAMYQLSDHWGLVSHVGLSYLTGSAKDSPLTQKAFQPNIAIGAVYRF